MKNIEPLDAYIKVKKLRREEEDKRRRNEKKRDLALKKRRSLTKFKENE